MVGVLFTLPQYFQAVAGDTAVRAGARLLPLVGGLVAGALLADAAGRVLGARRVISAGFAVVATGLVAGSATTMHSHGGYVAAWTMCVGLGLGAAMAASAATALVDVSEDDADVGAAVVQAMQKAGAPLGAVITGSVLTAQYRDQLLQAVPGASHASLASVFGGLQQAGTLHSTVLMNAVQSSFLTAMHSALLLTGGLAALGSVSALVLLPRMAAAPRPARQEVPRDWSGACV
jgi:hypothetical protein